MIREVKKPEPKPQKRPNLFLRMSAFILTLILALGAVYLVVNRDKLNYDALKRWFTYRSLAQSDTGSGETFSYQGGDRLTLTRCGNDLLSVSETGIRLYSTGGVAYVEDTLTLSAPVCHVSGSAAVVYDAGGTFLRVYRNRSQAFELEDNTATILSARLSSGGLLTVVTRANGYKGVVTVYGKDGSKILDLRLSSAYVIDGLVSPDDRSLLVVTAGQENRLFQCRLAQYSISDLDPASPTPVFTWDLGNALPIDLSWDSAGLRVMTEYSALSADTSLTSTGSVDWSDRYLKRYSLGLTDRYAVLTGKYRSGSQTTLQISDRSGAILASLEENRPILDLSAAGKYLAVLTAQKLDVYTRDLELYSSVENSQNASRVVLLEDGTAFLAGEDTAWLQLPMSLDD